MPFSWFPIPGAGGAAGAGLALLGAISWGGGDFSGGMGVKATGGSTRGAVRLVVTAHGLSLFVLLAILFLQHAQWPARAPILWGVGSGVAAGLSLVAFYIALARGGMGASAAVSGLLAAAIPASVSIWLEGVPGPWRLLGFFCAAAAIWMIAVTPGSSDAPSTSSRSTTALAVTGGVGFGIYFVGLRFANTAGVMEPIALARAGSFLSCLLLLACLKGPASTPAIDQRGMSASGSTAGSASRSAAGSAWLSRQAWLWALGVAVLDTGGNLLFIAATRAGRLDVAAVLASLYPASTILLAAFLLHERPGRRQLIGMAVALVAVVLITV